jgi:hypothetical protein
MALLAAALSSTPTYANHTSRGSSVVDDDLWCARDAFLGLVASLYVLRPGDIL